METDYESRFVGAEYSSSEDNETELSLRPKVLADYIGQDKVKDNLSVYIEAAKQRGEPLDHVLLYGPPGLGKTTLAGIIANEMGVNFRVTSGPAIEKPGDLAALLTNPDAVLASSCDPFVHNSGFNCVLLAEFPLADCVLPSRRNY